MENLCCKIENLRQKMHETAIEKGISHPDVLRISCELDALLNEFYRISLRKKNMRYEKRSGCLLGYRSQICPPTRKSRLDRIFRMIGQAASNS